MQLQIQSSGRKVNNDNYTSELFLGSIRKKFSYSEIRDSFLNNGTLKPRLNYGIWEPKTDNKIIKFSDLGIQQINLVLSEDEAVMENDRTPIFSNLQK